jgi:hypothetical protein
MHRTYRSLNKILTICGCERRLFLSGMFVGLGLFMSTSSIIVGLATFVCFAGFGYFTAQDPIVLRLIFNPGRFRNQYDPAIKRPFAVTYYESRNQF